MVVERSMYVQGRGNVMSENYYGRDDGETDHNIIGELKTHLLDSRREQVRQSVCVSRSRPALAWFSLVLAWEVQSFQILPFLFFVLLGASLV